MSKIKAKARILFSDLERGFNNGLRVLAQITDSNLEAVRITKVVNFIDEQMKEPMAERTDWIAKFGTPNSKGIKTVREENLTDENRKAWRKLIEPWRRRVLEVDFNSDQPTGNLVFKMFDSDSALLPQQLRELLVKHVTFQEKTGENPRDAKRKLEAMGKDLEALKKKLAEAVGNEE